MSKIPPRIIFIRLCNLVELIFAKYFTIKNVKQNKAIKKLLLIFMKLKKKYRWGTNYYYRLSGKYKIHPTYIQSI